MTPLQADISTMRATIADMLKTLDAMERKIESTPLIAHGCTIDQIKNIFRVVCDHYGVPESFMHLKARSHPVMMPRHVAMFLARETTQYTSREIASCFRPDMDRATIEHGCKRITDQLTYDSDLRAVIEKLTVESRKRIEATATFIPATR